MSENSHADQPNTRNRKIVMTEGFIEGGLTSRPIIIELPPIAEVLPGSVYQDAETGTIWKAINGGLPVGRWVQAETVTASEHAELKSKRLIYLLVALAATVFSWTVLAGAFPLPPAPWNVLILLALIGMLAGYGWLCLRTDRAIASHLVAPSPEEDRS
ncbi:hypothetical protein [Agreia sp. COWG]|uniref:hypothetical protein n=1 Tax=Agreia sp. COWG TaxID=2773266 RepID=UPI001927C178|nr:hypothetical protein [Agreia sp. COWG]CAD6016174.1 conserved protein of unknown function [Agreia sp. COWG]